MVKCDIGEVLRYMGYCGQEILPETLCLIEKIAEEAQACILPKYCTLKIRVKNSDVGVASDGITFVGEDIKKHLSGCDEAILIAATLGFGMEQKIRTYEASELVKAVIMDSCGSALIESYLDMICGEIGERLKKENLFLTARFSPGYGDLPLSLQKDFLRAVNAERKIGLTCNESFLLSPRKSVTAIVGITRDKPDRCLKLSCDMCNMAYDCPYRKK